MLENAGDSKDFGTMDLRKLSREVDEEVSREVPDKKSVPLVPRRFEIEVIYNSPEGERLQGIGISLIKTGDDRVKLAKLASRLADGMPWMNMPPAAQIRLWALANITVQLHDAPEWVYKWIQEDDDLLLAISTELEGHEHRYFRRYTDESDPDKAQPKLVVRAANTSSNPTESDLADPTRLIPGG